MFAGLEEGAGGGRVLGREDSAGAAGRSQIRREKGLLPSVTRCRGGKTRAASPLTTSRCSHAHQAEDVRCIADNELGFQQATLSRPAQAKTYLFINTERMVVGCLVAENIRQVTLLHF